MLLVPSAPTITSATSAVFSQIELVWTAPEMPNGIIRDYQISYHETKLGPDSAIVLTTGSSGLEFTITGLTAAFTSYSVTVAAITIAPGNESAVVVIRTNENGESLACKHNTQALLAQISC